MSSATSRGISVLKHHNPSSITLHTRYGRVKSVAECVVVSVITEMFKFELLKWKIKFYYFFILVLISFSDLVMFKSLKAKRTLSLPKASSMLLVARSRAASCACVWETLDRILQVEFITALPSPVLLKIIPICKRNTNCQKLSFTLGMVLVKYWVVFSVEFCLKNIILCHYTAECLSGKPQARCGVDGVLLRSSSFC